MERQEDDGDGVLNVSIFDQLLLQSQSKLLRTAADRLCRGGERETSFITDYFNGARPPALVAALAPTWTAGFEFLAHSEAVPESRRAEFLGVLLAHAAAETDYVLTDLTRDLLSHLLPEIATQSQLEGDDAVDSQSLLQTDTLRV